MNKNIPSTFPSISLVSSLNEPSLASYPTVYVPSSLISLTCLIITTGASVVGAAGATVVGAAGAAVVGAAGAAVISS